MFVYWIKHCLPTLIGWHFGGQSTNKHLRVCQNLPLYSASHRLIPHMSQLREMGAGQIVPRRNSNLSFLHMRTNSTPSICTCGKIVPHGFSHVDKQYPVFLHRRTNSTPSVNFPISLDSRSLHQRYNHLSNCT